MSLKLCNNCGMASRNLSAAGLDLYCEHCGEPETPRKVPYNEPNKGDVARQRSRLNLILATKAGRKALADMGYIPVKGHNTQGPADIPTIANMPGADTYVKFPSGKVKVVNLLRLLVQTQNAEFKAKYGLFLPNVGKLRPTLQKLRDEYEIPAAQSRTWGQMATLLRQFYVDLSKQNKEAQ